MQSARNSTGGGSGRLYDSESRLRKAQKILTILQEELGDSLAELRGLDVGCANGVIANHLAGSCRSLFGVDPEYRHFAIVPGEKCALLAGDGVAIPFPDDSFDLVICAQVYEHAANPEAMVAEIARVLKHGGVVFFSGPNKYSVIEDHYGVPFLSWLPKAAADWIVRLMGKGSQYEEHPRSLSELKALWGGFEIKDVTLQLILHPDKYGLTREVKGMKWMSRLPVRPLELLRGLYPNYNWILRKKTELVRSGTSRVS